MNEQKNNEILMKAMMAGSQTEAIKIYCEETPLMPSYINASSAF